MEVALVRGPVVIVRLTTAGEPRPAWHLLVRATAAAAADPVALRPAGAAFGASIVDLLPTLSGHPSLLPPERFVVFATEGRVGQAAGQLRRPRAAPGRTSACSSTGRRLVLDFSRRPFDGVEFDRMLAVAEQVVGARG